MDIHINWDCTCASRFLRSSSTRRSSMSSAALLLHDPRTTGNSKRPAPIVSNSDAHRAATAAKSDGVLALLILKARGEQVALRSKRLKAGDANILHIKINTASPHQRRLVSHSLTAQTVSHHGHLIDNTICTDGQSHV